MKPIKYKVDNPNSKFSIDYALDELNEIQGDLTIIGLSPNNDTHIISSIYENDKIESVKFYYYEESEKELVSSILSKKKVITKDVKLFWKNM